MLYCFSIVIDCNSPQSLYPNGDNRNFAGMDNYISRYMQGVYYWTFYLWYSRSTPDGVHGWPVACTNVTCQEKIYEVHYFHYEYEKILMNKLTLLYQVLPRATWWDQFQSNASLPTNTWFIPYHKWSFTSILVWYVKDISALALIIPILMDGSGTRIINILLLKYLDCLTIPHAVLYCSNRIWIPCWLAHPSATTRRYCKLISFFNC